jgi:hypothetical protein
MRLKILTFSKKSCEYCGQEIVLKITRDLNRKKFCSKRCRQLGRIARGEVMGIMRPELRALSFTPECNAKKAHVGENHPRWLKDRTQVRVQRTIAELRWWRKAVFERDDYTCQKCGVRGGRLNAHHIKSYVLFPELRMDVSNGETLCVDCHKKTDTYGRAQEIQNSICLESATGMGSYAP